MAGLGAFVFSTVVITFLGEIIPQAYFSRNAVRLAARFSPFLKFYQIILFVVAEPTAVFLNLWLGPESVALLHERDFHTLLLKHVEAGSTDVGRLEATGALNFLDLDDIVALDEGEPVDPRSIIRLPIKGGWPVLPAFERTPRDVFLRQLDASGRKWVIFVDERARRASFWTPTIFCATSSSTKCRSVRSPIGIARSSSPTWARDWATLSGA